MVQAERSERWTHRTERSEPRPSTVNRSRQAPPEAVGAAGGVSVGPTSRSGQASQAARPYHAWAAGPPFARQPLTRALMAAGGLAGPKATQGSRFVGTVTTRPNVSWFSMVCVYLRPDSRVVTAGPSLKDGTDPTNQSKGWLTASVAKRSEAKRRGHPTAVLEDGAYPKNRSCRITMKGKIALTIIPRIKR